MSRKMDLKVSWPGRAREGVERRAFVDQEALRGARIRARRLCCVSDQQNIGALLPGIWYQQFGI